MQVIYVLAKRNMHWFIYNFISEEEHSFSPSNICTWWQWAIFQMQYFEYLKLSSLSLCLHVLHVQYVQWLLFSWIQSVIHLHILLSLEKNILSKFLCLERNIPPFYIFSYLWKGRCYLTLLPVLCGKKHGTFLYILLSLEGNLSTFYIFCFLWKGMHMPFNKFCSGWNVTCHPSIHFLSLD